MQKNNISETQQKKEVIAIKKEEIRQKKDELPKIEEDTTTINKTLISKKKKKKNNKNIVVEQKVYEEDVIRKLDEFTKRLDKLEKQFINMGVVIETWNKIPFFVKLVAILLFILLLLRKFS